MLSHPAALGGVERVACFLEEVGDLREAELDALLTDPLELRCVGAVSPSPTAADGLHAFSPFSVAVFEVSGAVGAGSPP